MAIEPDYLTLARADLGTKEVAGKGSNPKVLAYYADAGHPEIRDDSVAWCAAYVGACLKRAGYPNTGSLAARSYLTYGTALKKPEPGCIVVMSRGDPSSWEGHVGFYVGETATHVKVLGGNQSDAVNIQSFPKTRVLGYRRPPKAGSVVKTITVEKKTATEVVKESKHLPATGNAVVALVAGVVASAWQGISDLAQATWTTVGVAVGVLPDVSAQTVSLVGSAQALVSTFNVPWPMMVGTGFAIACATYALVRETRRRMEGPK